MLRFVYRFLHKDGHESRFEVALDPETLMHALPEGEPPAWTALGNKQCPNCPLKEASHPHCPVARNLAPVIAAFKDSLSYEEVEVIIATPQREFRKKVPLQSGVSALFGLVMVTSGCPILDRLRPMVYTHLPFATVQETFVRAISTYLLGQYLALRRGEAPDWELKGLVRAYEEINVVNEAFVARLRSVTANDATWNAIVTLDCFSKIASFSILGRPIAEVERVFHP